MAISVVVHCSEAQTVPLHPVEYKQCLHNNCFGQQGFDPLVALVQLAAAKCSQHMTWCWQVDELEAALTEANNRLTRLDEADKRLVGTAAAGKPETPAKSASGSAVQADAKPQAFTQAEPAPAKQ